MGASGGDVQGIRSANPFPIDAILDGSTNRLAVDAKFTSGFVAEVNLDETSDEVAVFGGVNGSETADAATRQIINVDTTGHVRTDLAKVGGNAISVDGGRQQVNATLQIGDVDSPGGAGAVTASTPRVTLASDDPAVVSLSIIDDWDETDRAKVNLIVGQAGVAAGAGAVGATTQRTTLASDDPAVVSLAIMDDWDESDRAKVNPIVGQVGVQGGSGVVTALTQRVVLATDVALPPGSNSIGTVDTELPPAAALADNTANPSAPAVGSFEHLWDGATWDRQPGNSLGGAFVQGPAADGAAPVGNPVLTAGFDGTNVQTELTDTSGRSIVVGPAADGAAIPAANPLLLAGQDGTNVQSLLTDTTGRQVVVGGAASGAPPSGNPVLIGGTDTTNAQTMLMSTSGHPIVALRAASPGTGDGISNTQAVPAGPTGGALTNLVFPHLFNGTTWDRMRGDTNGQFAQGNIAHDSVDAGNPVKIGMRAIAHGTNPTAVAAADRTDWLSNRAGVPFVMGGHPNILTQRTAVTTALTDSALVTVAGGLKIVVTRILVTTSAGNTATTTVRIGFGATTTPTTTGVVASHPGIPAGAGFNTGDGSGILGLGGDGEDLRITNVDPGGTMDVVVSYYTIES